MSKIEEDIILKDGATYNVVDSEGNTLPSQITYDGKLIFQPQLKAKESKEFRVLSSPQQEFPKKVYANHYAERYGDFAWENDRVGFRFYGAPLKEIQAPSNGLDLWYKRTDRLVLDEWYKKDISEKHPTTKTMVRDATPMLWGALLVLEACLHTLTIN